MFNQDEIRLLHAPGMDQFPLIRAVASLYRECQTCRARRANPKSALVLAMGRYKSNPAFVKKVKELFGRPAYLGGHMIGE